MAPFITIASLSVGTSKKLGSKPETREVYGFIFFLYSKSSAIELPILSPYKASMVCSATPNL